MEVEEKRRIYEELIDLFIKTEKTNIELKTLYPSINKDLTIINGFDSLIQIFNKSINETQLSIIVILPEIIPPIMLEISNSAYQKRNTRFMVFTEFDLNEYGTILKKLIALGNIQIRKFMQPCNYFAILRDSIEMIIAILKERSNEIIGLRLENSIFFHHFQYLSQDAASKSRPFL